MNSSHTATQGQDSLRPPLAKAWAADLGGAVSYPLIAGGRAFVVVQAVDASGARNGGGKLVAMDLASGRTLWTYGSLAPGSPRLTPPAYDAGRVYVVTQGGMLTAFVASSGAQAWSVDLSDHNSDGSPRYENFLKPPTAVDGIVYLGASDRGGAAFFAVDDSSGTTLWIAWLRGDGSSTPAVTADGIYVVEAGHVYKLRRTDGSVVWERGESYSGGGGVAPTPFGGRLYDRLNGHILDIATGQLLGRHESDQPSAFDGAMRFNLEPGQPSRLVARDLTSDTAVWVFFGDTFLATAPVVANGVIYVGSASGVLWAVRESDGAVLTHDFVGGRFARSSEDLAGPPSNLAVAEGRLLAPAGSILTAWVSAPEGTPPIELPEQQPPADGYSITELTVPGGLSWGANGINDSQDIVGSVTFYSGVGPNTRHVFRWSTDGNIDIGALLSSQFGAANASLFGISNSRIVGGVFSAIAGNPPEHLFTFDGTNFTTLAENVIPGGLNSDGDVVGDKVVVINHLACTHAMLWTGGQQIDLGTLGGPDNCLSSARGINGSGQITGASNYAIGGCSRVTLWDETGVHDLGSVGGCINSGKAITEGGVIVGQSTVSSGGLERAFIWRQGVYTDIGVLPGYAVSVPNAINEQEVVVGKALGFGGAGSAFAYDSVSGMRDLNRLIDSNQGWYLFDAQSINNLSQIVGVGIHYGQGRAFILTPVQAPSPQPP